jgi:pectin methylesterase-like acyl-CoA thioesterase
LKSVLLILAILIIAGFAQAHRTVCLNGCDSKSIQAAVYAAHPNDTIDVYSGTYNESVVLTKDVTGFGRYREYDDTKHNILLDRKGI